MKKYLVLAAAAVLLFASCKDESNYINYERDDSYADTDGDGIPDVAEQPGTSFYNLPLYDWGARPNQPDLFIHIAPMNPATEDGGMMLQKKALDRVKAKFLENGIALHFDVGSDGLYEGYDEITRRGTDAYNLSGRSHMVPYSQYIDISGENYSSNLNDLMDEYMPSNRKQIFYFMVMGSEQYTYNGSSGIAYLFDRRFLITLAGWGLGFGTNSTLGLSYENIENYTVNTQASTIMHEFGHTLGLRHGGDINENYKPNYYSIMNYLYQLNGLPRIGTNEWDRYYYERYMESEDYPYQNDVDNWADKMTTSYPDSYYTDSYNYAFLLPIDFIDSPFSSTYNMDFSYGAGGDLDETALDETLGLRQSGSGSIDWNGSGTDDSPVTENINVSDTVYGTGTTTLSDFNDWGNLYFYYNNVSAGAARTLHNEEAEIATECVPRRPVLPLMETH
ncbi:MAG: zinc-dependent metalloprotease family protein [Spirochaetales bacterium]|nr:zinc-dependent metalloprotease family protein [Spirochaetales bacterium]